MEVLNYDEALETILKNISCLDYEEKDLNKAEGQVLAEDIYSDYDLPICDISIPDGYAVQAKDIEGADKNNPAILKIVDTVRAGILPVKTVLPGTAIRIMTGSVVPKGADCVVKFEDTDEPENKSGKNPNRPTHVKIYVSQAPGKFIHKKSTNIKKGDLLLPKNTVIRTAQISALTAIGKKTVKVIRRPKVAIITTGDELIRAGNILIPGKTYNSNESAIRSLVTNYGGISWVLGVVKDNEKSIITRVKKGLSADAIITTGGVSIGDYDLVQEIIGKTGELIISSIKLGPAIAFGLMGKNSEDKQHTTVPVFALEGPPLGCMIDFEMLVRPALLKMRGVQELNHPVVEAVSEESFTNIRPINAFKWSILKKTETGYTVKLNDANGLAHKANGNSLTIIPGGGVIKEGDKIQVLPLDWYK
jgi:molybdopterin molybdotransferase